MVTNSRKASVSIVAGTVLLGGGRQYTELVLVRRPSELVFGTRVSQSASEVSLGQLVAGVSRPPKLVFVSQCPQSILEVRRQCTAVPLVGSDKITVLK
jgi:hypothetical protein